MEHEVLSMSKVLVTGAGGYIGSVLVKELLSNGHEVVAFDRFFFGREPLSGLHNDSRLTICQKDIRDVEEADFAGVDAVCDLAALSNDPSAAIDANLTTEINYKGRASLAKVARNAGVSRYILSSSCSVYGTGESHELTEKSKTGPITEYAKSSLDAEYDTFALAGDNFSVTALRNATVFGLSKRMRFDLVINLMTLHAVRRGRIIVMGGGKQWRPLVHVTDVARAFRTVLEAPADKVNSEIFNVGLRNYQIFSLAYIVRESLPFLVEIEVAPDDADSRDYNASFDKAREVLGFQAKTDVPEGVAEIYNALKFGLVDDDAKTSTVNWYRSILDAKKLLDEVTLDGRIL
jgi:nucleoside-diphosphate-sugar epimerase